MNNILLDSRTYSQGETLNCPNCPNCGSKPIKADAPPPHHQKLICSECDRFIRWLPSPQSIQRSEETQGRIKALKLKQNKLSKWDAGFIESLWLDCCRADLEERIAKFSPRQLAKLAEIEASMGGTAR